MGCGDCEAAAGRFIPLNLPSNAEHAFLRGSAGYCDPFYKRLCSVDDCKRKGNLFRLAGRFSKWQLPRFSCCEDATKLQNAGQRRESNKRRHRFKVCRVVVLPKVAAAKKINLADKFRIKKWVDKQKNSEYVFNKLGLNGGLDQILTNPKVHIYAAYIDVFNKQNPTK
ncbi:hypothetical protein PC121_g9757 [Phytophthora cactorum]|nr:hypothetical protein PC120_g7664 [Phytophthora cactorum]KAG3069606.1 hypothetical protein PC121_g9757 [Phytophthora cactorum]